MTDIKSLLPQMMEAAKKVTLPGWLEADRENFIALASPSNILALCNAYIALEGERDEARAALAYLLDRAVYGDSYGVHGSDFQACHFCTGGGAPGVELVHERDCPVRRYPAVVSDWFEEMAEADKRAEAAEARLKVAVEKLERAAKYLDEMHSNHLRNDVDMQLDDCEDPSAVAEELRSVISTLCQPEGETND